MARTRHVFPTGEIPHKWFHAPQRDARNPQGNLYFRADVIYSYRDSWPLARIYRGKRGAPALVLGNSGRYSTTTAQHAAEVRRAVPNAVPYLEVPHCTRDAWGNTVAERDAQNVAELVGVAASALKKAQRAMLVHSAQWSQGAARSAIDNAVRYMDYFKMRGKRPVFPQAEWRAALARAERIQNPDPASADKRERASARRKVRAEEKRRRDAELAAVRDMARRTDWRLFGAFGAGRPDYGGPCMLRVDGEEIETSQGARIPLAAAPMVWAMVERQRAKGTDYAPQRGLGAGPKIGDYAISRIGGDGALVVGCHDIPHGELRQMARQLGLEVRP